jgi:hypothetical protein
MRIAEVSENWPPKTPVMKGTETDVRALWTGTSNRLPWIVIASEHLELRVTRPGFLRGIQALAASQRTNASYSKHRAMEFRKPRQAL